MAKTDRRTVFHVFKKNIDTISGVPNYIVHIPFAEVIWFISGFDSSPLSQIPLLFRS